MQSIANIFLRFIYLLPKRKEKAKSAQQDHIAKAFVRAQRSQLFEVGYENSANLRKQIVTLKTRASNLRTRNKLHKIDMALKVVLRRDTRKHKVDH